MEREERVRISRELVESIICKKYYPLKSEHFLMLSISRFIMVKEKLITTDSKTNDLYFDDTEENTKAIEKFYASIENSMYFGITNKELSFAERKAKINSLYDKVKLKSGRKDLELQRKIFIINKLRDSFAHGRYNFINDGKRIKVENDYTIVDQETNESLDYSFICQVHPETLNNFVQTTSKEKTTIDKVFSLIEYPDDSVYFNNLLVSTALDLNKRILKGEYKLDEESKILFNKTYGETLININKIINAKKYATLKPKKIMLTDKQTDKYLSKGYSDEIKLQSEEKIESLNDFYSYKSKTGIQEDPEKLEGYFKTPKMQKAYLNVTKDYIEEDRLRQKMIELLLSMALIIDKENSVNTIETAAIYNYLVILLGEKEELDFTYLKSPVGQIYLKKREDGNDITGTYNILRNAITDFNKKYYQCKATPEFTWQKTMSTIFEELYKEVIKAFRIRNKQIYNKIRNGIMHFTIKPMKNGIKITDSPNHDIDNPTFSCEISNKKIMEYATQIEQFESEKRAQEQESSTIKQSHKDNYTLKTFIEELVLALSNYEFTTGEIEEFERNLKDCLRYINKSEVSSLESVHEKASKMRTKGYLEDIKKLRDILLARKEELEDKPPSV